MAKFHPLEGYFRHSGEHPAAAYRQAREQLTALNTIYVKIIMMGAFLVQFFLIMSPLRDELYTEDSFTTVHRFALGLAGAAVISLYFVVRSRAWQLWVPYVVICGLITGLLLV